MAETEGKESPARPLSPDSSWLCIEQGVEVPRRRVLMKEGGFSNAYAYLGGHEVVLVSVIHLTVETGWGRQRDLFSEAFPCPLSKVLIVLWYLSVGCWDPSSDSGCCL